MSVLNLPSDGIFNVLIVVVRALVRFGPQTKEAVLKLCGADTPKVEASYLNNVLNRWEQLGLFSAEGGVIKISEPYKAQLGVNPDVAEARTPWRRTDGRSLAGKQRPVLGDRTSRAPLTYPAGSRGCLPKTSTSLTRAAMTPSLDWRATNFWTSRYVYCGTTSAGTGSRLG